MNKIGKLQNFIDFSTINLVNVLFTYLVNVFLIYLLNYEA